MLLLKEFEVNNTAVEEWLTWGGITRPQVMQQKDGSYFSVIEYDSYEVNKLTKKMEMPKFCRGWAMWNERQHTLKGDKNFLVIFWNPFRIKTNLYIKNTLGEKVGRKEVLNYFESVVEKIRKEISKVTRAKLLEYQELMDFLIFSLAVEEIKVEMPEVPLYMDALLSQDIKFEFKANDIFINDKKNLILSLPDLANVWEIFEKIEEFQYRYVRRILIFDETESEMELKKYAGKWCPNRKIMLDAIENGILSNFNGYYWNGFILRLDDAEYEEVRTYLEEYLTLKESAFVFEKYNLKDIWWGSLSGIYLANITPPVIGFNSVEEFILTEEEKQTDIQEQRFREILNEMERASNVQNG